MSKIQLMRPELANLIAAGEVIERPASVIKELVENSIDAGAKNIYVGVTDGGKGTILVKDDGSGMDREDTRTCFLRHASSKIKTEYDLNRIHTLGFRGEAIPSIAAVSHIVLTTSTGESEPTRVESAPNQELRVTAGPDRKGTIFEISDLFFNTPARLKYLKSNQTETYSIIECVEHLALGFPEISFSLAIDGKEIFRTSGRGDLLETIQKIYGNNLAQALYPVKYEGIAFSFEGYISKPEINYSRRKDMLTFLNNRCIYDYRINKAIEDAYKDYLAPLRYPFVAVKFTIDSSLVDVNVHPTKKEVRISVEDDMARAIKEQAEKTLRFKKPIYAASNDEKMERYIGKKDSTETKAEEPQPKAQEVSATDLFGTEDIEAEKQEKIREQNSTPFSYENIKPIPEKEQYFQDSLFPEPTYESTGLYHAPIKPSKPVDPIQPKPEEPSQEKPEAYYDGKDYYNTIFDNETVSYKLPEMHPIGQVLKTYIVCDSDEGLYLIDQHAAAERVNFEKTQALFASVRSRCVPLIPITVDLTYKEMENFDEEHIARLASVGIIAESFGGKTVKVTEIPSFLTTANDIEIVTDCVHSCLNDEKADPLELLHLTIANIACKKSIKANHTMSAQEIDGLLRDLSKCKNPANCPHGRPTIIKLTKEDIERIFRRSGF